MDKKNAFGFFITCWECGQVKVLGRISGVITLVTVLVTYLELKHIPLYWWQTILLGIGLICAILISGFIYQKFNLYQLEQGAIQKRNPELMEMKNDIKTILEKMEMKKNE